MLPSSDNTRDPVSLREGLRIRASAYSVSWILIGGASKNSTSALF